VIFFFQEQSGDFLAIDTDTEQSGRGQFEGRASAIAGLVGSVCTTGISRAYLMAKCRRVPRATVPAPWRKAIGL
jgi:hypothetical protein